MPICDISYAVVITLFDNRIIWWVFTNNCANALALLSTSSSGYVVFVSKGNQMLVLVPHSPVQFVFCATVKSLTFDFFSKLSNFLAKSDECASILGRRCNPLVCAAAAPRNEVKGPVANAKRNF
eukprot:sb/3475722/